MPVIIETKAYTLDELSDRAKEKARDWYRSRDYDDIDTEFMFDDFVRMGNILGIEFDTHAVKLHGGGERRKPNIYFSGFCSQGDGACFEGTWNFRRLAVEEIKAEAPQDTTLHGIAERLWPMCFGAEDNLWASLKHTGSYYHENSVDIEVGEGDSAYVESETVTDATVDQIVEALRDFCRWMYSQLDNENDYRNSDECVDGNIEANEYLFDEDGEFVQ